MKPVVYGKENAKILSDSRRQHKANSKWFDKNDIKLLKDAI